MSGDIVEKIPETVTNASIRATLMEWLVVHLASALEMPAEAIDVGRNLEDYGLDSMQAVGLTGDLQSWLGVEIPPTAIWDHTTVESTCEFLVRLIPAYRSATNGAASGRAETKRRA